MPCPHCHRVGNRIQHGYLRGYDQTSQSTTIRAHRVFCSNRNARHGCGRTFSFWRADIIRRLKLTTYGLWRFLLRTLEAGIAAASRTLDCRLSYRTFQRIHKRFRLGQSHIRTTLSQRCPPPDVPADSRPPPEAQTIAHLQNAFPNADCPITDFQQTSQTFFM